MYRQLITSSIIALTLCSVFQSAAYSVPTKWEKVEISLSELLNSGWQLLGVSSNRVAFQNSFSPNGLDEQTYVFSLIKDGKYIICAMTNPSVPVAKVAGCRRIN
jgi:hypothetical protein